MFSIHPGIGADWRVSVTLRIVRSTPKAYLVAEPFDGPVTTPGIRTTWVPRSLALADTFGGDTCPVSVPAWLARRIQKELSKETR